ncbi:protein of unknown function [Pseudomonas sp. JV551A1]|uniref:Uncharacterized protein n=1 Tax=Pseudomonas inefficax TaxID=2078786 RepID=A0AAQ1P9E8_9PSED|nr:protein of unknown function [Pseudomonas sp. JV551A1]SPO62289.1 protein of unknown function [Pseudomonas inefficax]
MHADGGEHVGGVAGGESGILEGISADRGARVLDHVATVLGDVGRDDAAAGAHQIALPLAGPVSAEAVADVLHRLGVGQLGSQVGDAVAFVEVQGPGTHAALLGLAKLALVVRVIVGNVRRFFGVEILPVADLGSALAVLGNVVQGGRAGDDARFEDGGLLGGVHRLQGAVVVGNEDVRQLGRCHGLGPSGGLEFFECVGVVTSHRSALGLGVLAPFLRGLATVVAGLPGTLSPWPQVGSGLAQRFRPFEGRQRGLAVLPVHDFAGTVGCDRLAVFAQLEGAAGAKDDVLGSLGQRTGLDGGSADGISQHLVAVLGGEGFGLVRTLVGCLDLLVQVGAQALGAAADDLVQLALGDQLGLFILAGLCQQALDRFDIQTVELAFQLVQFSLDGLVGADQLSVFGLESRNLPVHIFLHLAAQRLLEGCGLSIVEGEAVGGRIEVERHVIIPLGLVDPLSEMGKMVLLPQTGGSKLWIEKERDKCVGDLEPAYPNLKNTKAARAKQSLLLFSRHSWLWSARA